jgi:hypothetical protein
MAAGEGGVWIGTGPNLIHVDAQSATFRRAIPYLGATAGVSLAVGFRTVWLIGQVPNGVDRLDPATDTFLRPVAIPTGFPDGVAVGSGSAWVSTNNGKVFRLDAATGRILGTITVATSLDTVVYTPGGCYEAGLTPAACGPFCPWVTSNSTFCPSSRFLYPSPAMALKCTNTSALPSSGVMKP